MGAKSELTGNSEFGDILRMSRISIDATLEELGLASGVSFTRIAALERGTHTKPRTETIYKIANGLHLLGSNEPAVQREIAESPPKMVVVPETLIIDLQKQVSEIHETISELRASSQYVETEPIFSDDSAPPQSE